MPERVVLITGSSGYLGRALVRHLLATTPHRLVLWQRQTQHPLAANPRVTVTCGDLTADGAFAAIDPGPITDVVHLAAATRFNLEREQAQSVNVDGTRQALELAERCPRLASFVLVSSVYSCGLTEGLIPEDLHCPAAFANHYEWSKHAAEQLVAARNLPWRILRTATVLCDDPSGRVTQSNAVHNTLKLFYYGLLSILPGDPRTPVHLTHGSECVRTLARMLDAPERTIVQVAPERPLSLDRVLEVSLRTFREDTQFAGRRVPKPLLSDLDSFQRLRESALGFGGEVMNQALESVAPFAPQLISPKQFDTVRWRSLGVADSIPPEELLVRTCRMLVASRWGREARHVA